MLLCGVNLRERHGFRRLYSMWFIWQRVDLVCLEEQNHELERSPYFFCRYGTISHVKIPSLKTQKIAQIKITPLFRSPRTLPNDRHDID